MGSCTRGVDNELTGGESLMVGIMYPGEEGSGWKDR